MPGRVEPNARTEDGTTALMLAAWFNEEHPEAVAALLDARADVNARNEAGMTALMLAARWNTPDALRPLLAAEGLDLEARDEEGRTALMFAARGNTREGVELLLRAGADVNARSKYGVTALWEAIWWLSYDLAVIPALIEAGADIGERYKGGATPLIWAARNTPEAVELLLDAGALVPGRVDPNARDDEGKRAVDHARESPEFKGTEAMRRLEAMIQ